MKRQAKKSIRKELILAFLISVVIRWFHSYHSLAQRLVATTAEQTPPLRMLQLDEFRGKIVEPSKSVANMNIEVRPSHTKLERFPLLQRQAKRLFRLPRLPPVPKTSTEKVAYCISITECQWSVRDAAAVHAHAIDLAQLQSRYGHVRYALVHTSARQCAKDLKQLGYEVLVRELPFNVTGIHNAVYQRKIEEDGCCGSKEYMKLWVYSLTKHKMAIHLDIDTLLLQPIDDIWDAMLDPNKGKVLQTEPSSLYQPNGEHINFMFTRDYAMGSTIISSNETDRHQITTKWGVQGGFFVVEPSQWTLAQIVRTVMAGQYSPVKGWSREGYGGYWGAAQIQGLLSYIYRPVNSARNGAVELNRCIYNNMHDPMYFQTGRYKGKCTTWEETCANDCRSIPFEKVKLAHLTMCTKPWNCEKYDPGLGLCDQMLQRWFETRLDLEGSWNLTFPRGDKSSWFYTAGLGYCRKLLRKKEKRDSTGKEYKTYKGSYRRMVFPWDKKVKL